MIAPAAERLTSNSGTQAAGASAQLIPANNERNGLNVVVDVAAAGAFVYLLLGTGTASATNWHICLSTGGSWDGTLGDGTVWRGAIQFFSATAPQVGIAEF